MLHKRNQSIMEGASVKGCDYPLQKGAKSKKIAARKAARALFTSGGSRAGASGGAGWG